MLQPMDFDAPLREQLTPRWKAQERLIHDRFGSFHNLGVIEIGAGRGTNALLYALRGAQVALLDSSATALQQAEELFRHHTVPLTLLEGDVFSLPPTLRNAFQVSMSFGLCEHFLGEQRLAVIRSHLDVLQPGGIAMLGVPNRWAPAYRLWMRVLKTRGSWPLGTEVPFSVGELKTLARAAGGVPGRVQMGSAVASPVDHGLNQLLFKLGKKPVRVPQVRTPLLDRFAYELLLPVTKP